MLEYGRLSRRDRLRLSGKRRAQFALVLALLLLILVVIRIGWPQIKDRIAPPDYDRIQAVADSLIVKAGRSFALSDTAVVDSLLNQNNPRGENYVYRSHDQPWPGILPFEFYVERLQELCRDEGLICDCRESSQNRLTCTVGVSGYDGARVVVRRSAKTGLTDRRVAFVFRNLGAMGNSEITRIAENGLLFGYVASPDVYPSVRVKRTLETAGVTSILEIPAGKSSLEDFSGRSAGSEGGTGSQNDRDLAASLFDRHPNPAAIIIKRSGPIDSSFVAGIIEEAKVRKAGYIYDNTSPDTIDSLAYSSGLVFLNMKGIADFSEGRFDQNRSALLRELILSREPVRQIVEFDGSAVEAEELLGLQRSFQKLGVKLTDCRSLMEIRESL